MAALKTVLAGVTNLSTSTVSVNDWGVQNHPYSVVIFPSLGGQQRLLYAGGYEQAHRIKAKLCIKHQDARELYDRSAAMIPLILTALASNDGLGLAGVVTMHMDGAPVTWESPTGDAIIRDDNGVLSKEIDFTLTVWTS